MVGGGGAAFAQETIEAPAAAAAVEPAPSVSFLEANQKASARLESVQDKSLDELKGLLTQSESSLPTLSQTSTARNDELREARIAADREAPEIQALYKQIEGLQAQIARVTDTLPGVKEKLDAYNQAQSDLFQEMQFRTKLKGLIASKETSGATGERELKQP